MYVLSGAGVIQYLQEFFLDSGILASKLYTDFYKQIIPVSAQQCLITNDVKIVTTPAGCNIQNILAEQTWLILLEMS